MSLASMLVSTSQAFRAMAERMRKSIVSRIDTRLDRIEEELVETEKHRSKKMRASKAKQYETMNTLLEERRAIIAKIDAYYDRIEEKAAKRFQQDQASIALAHQARADKLKEERELLTEELARMGLDAE